MLLRGSNSRRGDSIQPQICKIQNSVKSYGIEWKHLELYVSAGFGHSSSATAISWWGQFSTIICHRAGDPASSLMVTTGNYISDSDPAPSRCQWLPDISLIVIVLLHWNWGKVKGGTIVISCGGGNKVGWAIIIEPCHMGGSMGTLLPGCNVFAKSSGNWGR